MLKKNFISNYSRIPSYASSQLDSLRGLSALLVLIAHTNQILVAPTTTIFSGIGILVGQAAVMVFFVLSGFLIGKSLTGNINKNSSLDIKKYFYDRFNRLYPPLILSIIIVGVLYIIAPYLFATSSLSYIETDHYLARENFEITLSSLFSSMFFLNGFIGETISVNGPLWSLSYEFWYYVIAALLLKSSKPFYAIMLSILTISLFLLNSDFFLHGIVWFLGLFICILHNNNVNNKNFHNLAYTISIVGIVASLYIFIGEKIGFKIYKNDFIEDHQLIIFKIFIGLFTSCFIYSILLNTIKFTSAFKSASSYSYTLYIVHFPILLFIFGVFQPIIQGSIIKTLIFSVFSCILIILISLISAKKVENIKILKY